MSDRAGNPHEDRPLTRDDAEWSRLTEILRVVAWTIALGAVVPVLHNAFRGRWRSVAVLLVAEAGVLVAQALNRRGHLDAAVWALVGTVQVCTAALVVVGMHGFHDVALMLFPATLVVAGLLLNRHARGRAARARPVGRRPRR